jgi:quinol monooxygenase YgiN
LREPRRYAVLESFPNEEMEHAHMNSPWLAAAGPRIVDCLDGTWEREYLDPFEA